MTETIKAKSTANSVANEWYERCSTVAVGHYKTAESYARRHAQLSGFSAILSAIVGTSVFATLQLQPEPWIKIAVGFLSIVAAVLATLSATLNFQDKAERHRTAASKYNAVGRELEELLIPTSLDPQMLPAVRARLDALAELESLRAQDLERHSRFRCLQRFQRISVAYRY
jgi:hypothetical protein